MHPWCSAVMQACPALAEVLAKSVCLAALAALAYLTARRARAAVRAACMDAALAALILLPVLSLALPALPLRVLPPSPADMSAISPTPAEASDSDSPDSLSAGEADPFSSAALRAPLGEMRFRHIAGRLARSAHDRAPASSGAPAVAPAKAVDEPSAVSRALLAAAAFASAQRNARWFAWACGIYVAVAALLSLRLVGGLFYIRRMRRRSRSVEDEGAHGLLDRVKGKMRIRYPVALEMSDNVRVPTACGWLRPAVVIPEYMRAPGNDDLLEAALLHELAHIRRGDLWWTLVWQAAAIVYWPNALVWWCQRRATELREMACDDWCASELGSGRDYCDKLRRIAEMVAGRVTPRLAASMARRENIIRRLTRVAAISGRLVPRVTWHSWTAILAAAVIVCGCVAPARMVRRVADAETASVALDPVMKHSSDVASADSGRARTDPVADKSTESAAGPEPSSAIAPAIETAEAPPAGPRQPRVFEADPSNFLSTIDSALPGDTVILADGDYGSDITMRASGAEGAPITVKAAGRGAVVSGGSVGVNLENVAWLAIEGLTIRGNERAGVRIIGATGCAVRRCVITGSAGAGVDIARSRRIAVEANEIAVGGDAGLRISSGSTDISALGNYVHDNAGAGLRVCAPDKGAAAVSRLVVERNRIARNGSKGGGAVDVCAVQDSVIRNNVLYRNYEAGIVLSDRGAAPRAMRSARNRITHNTVYLEPSVGECCLALRGGRDTYIHDNIFQGGTRAAVGVASASFDGLDMDNNVIGNYDDLPLLGNLAPAQNQPSEYPLGQWRAEKGLDRMSRFDVDPLFVSVDGDDYRLQAGSPATDAGATTAGPNASGPVSEPAAPGMAPAGTGGLDATRAGR